MRRNRNIEDEDISREEIQGYCEAYEVYLILRDESQKRLPREFVEKMKYYAWYELGNMIEVLSDINPENISREGAKKIAYMM